ncbi:MAG: hypothetical protein J7578_15235, partial [Chitinophagaceae bacterium]|nr:hypothetical protein [Chitinophagaceae bacterium]
MKKNQMRAGSSRSFTINCTAGTKSLLSFLLLIACTFTGFAQNPIRVSGKVQSAAGLPLGGATVAVKNSQVSTTTDSLGSFTLTAP